MSRLTPKLVLLMLSLFLGACSDPAGTTDAGTGPGDAEVPNDAADGADGGPGDTGVADAGPADAEIDAAVPDDPVWSSGYGGEGTQTTNALAFDSAGALLAAGQFEGRLDFGDGEFRTAGGFDVFVAKFDREGNHSWSKTFGSDDRYQYAHAVATDSSDNVFIAGTFNGYLDFGGGELTSAGGQDAFIAKFDRDGNHIWSHRYGDSADYQVAESLAIDDEGNVFIAGHFQGAFDLGGGELTSSGSSDIFLAKLDNDGNHIWSSRFGDDFSQKATTVAVDGDGNVIIGGEFNGAASFGGDTLESAGGSDPFVAAFDADGNHRWSRLFGGPETRQLAVAVGADAAGNVFVGAHFEGTVNFGGEDMINEGYRAKDVAIAKFDADGSHLWSRHFGDDNPQNLAAIAVDRFGNVALSGELRGSIDFGGGELTSSSYTGFVAKLDGSGAHIWSHQLGGADGSAGLRAVATNDATGLVAAGGQFRGDVDFGGEAPISSPDDYDLFVACFAP